MAQNEAHILIESPRHKEDTQASTDGIIIFPLMTHDQNSIGLF